jgi:hypothetical protein
MLKPSKADNASFCFFFLPIPDQDNQTQSVVLANNAQAI